MGGYKLLYKLASGSFGRVFRAENVHTGEVAAVKVLRRRWLDDQDKIELFEREGKVGLTLKHPNIVEVFACNRDDASGQYYLVMEFVEGGNVRDILQRRGTPNEAEALRIAEECADGLAFAVSQNLTHRDLKQTNILIAASGEAKLVDFGLAEIALGNNTAANQMGGEVARTVEYAGLERATHTKAGDPRSDIFFLGCVLFEMVTGKRLLPSSKERSGPMMAQHFQVQTKVRELAGMEISPKVISLIEKMVAFEPEERFQTPELLLDSIRAVRANVTGEKPKERDSGPITVFVVEEHPKLQDAFRTKLRELGFRVLISIDGSRAIQRFKQEPYQALILDVGTTGREGVEQFEKVMNDAELSSGGCLGILLLSEDQAHYRAEVRDRLNVDVLVRPVTMKEITRRLKELLPSEVSTES